MSSREAELEAEIRRLRAQGRRDTDMVNDAEEQTRVYRRLVMRLVKERDDAYVECERLRMRLATKEDSP